MKHAARYRRIVPVEEVPSYPDAVFVQNIFNAAGSAVLVPNKVPIGEILAKFKNPDRLVSSLKGQGIDQVELEFSHRVDNRVMKELLKQIDSSFETVNPEVSQEVGRTMSDIFSKLTIDQKFNFPKGEVDRLGGMLSQEIRKTSQILYSLTSPEQTDSYTQTHSLNVSLLAGFLAKRLCEIKKCEQPLVDKAVKAGLLFDLGKSAMPREILEKSEPLTPEEREIIKQHPLHSERIARQSGVDDQDILLGIRHHHERWDGSGYPDGLKGKDIPMIARILAVADTFDAMTSNRGYKDAVSAKAAFNFVMSANETHFDPDVCKVLLSGMGIYPPGSVVELSDGTVGTVAASTEGNLLQPKILVREKDGSVRIIELHKETHRKLFIKRALDV
ncbi:HD-GYP domain-containing protein [Thermanaerovibrio velox DSM 12556]|uniref:HD-GYP domain-containing protein n=1 Tax=Thermanaerovibrio velox DSM 12556 TaxID=926567 RepID=H0UQL0_9BACT|nr:HD-GYP domain-containing protein [Thermanaerovibrio velox DSM 12556]